MSSLKINLSKYADLYIPKNNKSMDEICNVGAFSYQKQQQFVKRWFAGGKHKLLLFHGLGSGKTCSSILAIESLKNSVSRVYVVTPASLKDNYKKELTGLCGGYKTVPKNVTVMSHNGFVKSQPKLDDCLVIIDEVQNVVSSTGTMYKTIFNMLVTKNPKNLKVVLLSATPMFDQPHEIALTLNLLNLSKPLPVLKFYTNFLAKNQTVKNEKEFFNSIKGYVSAFKGISPNAYAKRSDTVLLCNMSSHQLGSYTKSAQGLTMDNVSFSQAFLSGPRISSNVVYQSGGFGSSYRPTDNQLMKQFKESNLKNLSAKFYKCLQMLKKISGTAFVYSNFVTAGGINDFAICLKSNGYSEINPLKPPKSPGNRFGVFRTGKEKENSALVALFNSPQNNNGRLLKAILGSPAMKEGISLRNTRSVHLLDPYWNKSRTEQIIGRAIRFCSHVTLPQDQRHVDVYHYVSNISTQKRKTVDQHIMNMSNNKAAIVSQFENLLYKAAVDCVLFHNVNGLSLTQCEILDKNMVQTQMLFNESTKIKMNANGRSLNSNTEKALKDLLNMQVVKVGNKRQRLGFQVTVYAPKNINFEFNTSGLTRMIHTKSYKKSKNSYAMIQMVMKNKGKSSASLKNNDKYYKHLGFNKGVVYKQKPKIQGGGGGGKNKVPPEFVGCPKIRRPVDGKCSSRFPYLHKDEKSGKSCCFKKPTRTKGIVKTENGKVYIDGKQVNTLTYNQLGKVAHSFGKRLLPSMRRRNIINIIKKTA